MKPKDITGVRRGGLVAVEFYDIQIIGKEKRHRWKFLCDCGKWYVARKDSFMRGGHTSCGCRLSIPVEIGQRFGKWTVESKFTRSGKRGFNCICDCGNKSWVCYTDLTKNKSTKCLECGFQRHEAVALGEAARRRLFSSYKKNAMKRSYPFELSFEDFKNLISQNCYYSGHPPMSVGRSASGTKAFNMGVAIMYNGVDRKDNSLGYTKENSVPCCQICNRAKRAMPYDEWESWVKTFRDCLTSRF